MPTLGRPRENPVASYDPLDSASLSAGGKVNCHLPRIPLTLFAFLENFLVLIDLVAQREGDGGQRCLCGSAEVWDGASFFIFLLP